jgi:hypothetical protein
MKFSPFFVRCLEILFEQQPELEMEVKGKPGGSKGSLNVGTEGELLC